MSRKPKASAPTEETTPTLVPKLRFPEFRDAEGWPVKMLGCVAENLDSMRVPITSSNRTSGNVPYYGASGVIDYVEGFIFDEDLLCVSEDGANLVARTYPIAYSITGKAWVNNHAHVLRFPNACSQKFVEAYLNWIKLGDFVTRMAQPKLNRAMLDIIPIPYPDVTEQQKIAECLSSVDDLIAAQARKLDALKTHKKGLMQQLFPREGETQPRLRFTEFQNAGEWEVRKLGSLCDIQRGKFSHRPRNDPRFFGGQYPFIQTGDVVKSGGGAVVASQSLNEEGLAVSRLFKPTIVLITIAANIGDTGLLQTEGCFTDSVVGLIPKEDVAPIFLELIMRGQKEYLNKVATTGAQKNINNDILREVSVLLPTVREQQRIAACLSSLDELIMAEEEKLEVLKTHKRGLMQQLFPSAEAPGEAA